MILCVPAKRKIDVARSHVSVGVIVLQKHVLVAFWV